MVIPSFESLPSLSAPIKATADPCPQAVFRPCRNTGPRLHQWNFTSPWCEVDHFHRPFPPPIYPVARFVPRGTPPPDRHSIPIAAGPAQFNGLYLKCSGRPPSVVARTRAPEPSRYNALRSRQLSVNTWRLEGIYRPERRIWTIGGWRQSPRWRQTVNLNF
jgi:hypothetical protein